MLSQMEELLQPSLQLGWDVLDLVQDVPVVPEEELVEQLFTLPPTIGRSAFRFKRSGIEGTIVECVEEPQLGEIATATAANSLSVSRKYASREDAATGKTSFLPFKPGGLYNAAMALDERQLLHKNSAGLYDRPLGFERGLLLEGADDGVAELHLDEEEAEAPHTEEPALDYQDMREQLEEERLEKRQWAHVVDLDHDIDNFEDVVPHMARTWPFELDTFQKEAVYHLEQGDSVFVAAHTSAGKTVVAEYAIAMASRNMTKTIYTSPIKALSNQKFRDFKETFSDTDVGLITGDVQINPEANCLIMTTEVLRLMLYRGADLIRDVEFVIFDEVHYVNDVDRGVVWEEVIIMLPDHVKYILLSATVPNTLEFASWVGRTKQKDIYVIPTPKRPVPLEVFVWAKNELISVIEPLGRFNEANFKKHTQLLEADKEPPKSQMGSGSKRGPGGTARGGNRGGGRGRGRGSTGGRSFARDGPNKNTWSQLVKYLNLNALLPVVVFVFSKKRCEDYVSTLSGVSFTNAKERLEIHMFFERATLRLRKEDRELPQILKVRELLSRGIAVHHGGLLPIVKECIEILFAKSLVKVLFATETFAMGLNLPTRTVVFAELRKHDGRAFRNLLPGEFTQMAGRAGRRGLDDTGTVIVMAYNQPLAQSAFKEVTVGQPTKLLSQFRLTYNMILNLLRIEALRVEEMIKHSFSENLTQLLMPQHRIKVEELTKELETAHVDEVPNSQAYLDAFDLLQRYKQLVVEAYDQVHKIPSLRNTAFPVGRVLVFEDNDLVVRFGILVKVDRLKHKIAVLTIKHGQSYEELSRASRLPFVPVKSYIEAVMPQIQLTGKMFITTIGFHQVQLITRQFAPFKVDELLKKTNDTVERAQKLLGFVTRYPKSTEEFGFKQFIQLNVHELLKRKAQAKDAIEVCTIYKEKEFPRVYSQLARRRAIEAQIDSIKLLFSEENLELLPDYEQRLKVLEELNFTDSHQRVVLKGRVACEINSGWELVLTELILDNFLGEYEPEEIVALLSCFVYEGRAGDDEEPPMTPRLEKGKTAVLDIVKKLTRVYEKHHVLLTSDEEEFVTRKRFALINVVYEWARGMLFHDIMKISPEVEGTIVRVITRLDEICREVKNAALIVGDSALHSKVGEAQERIKRDIVFCASLYI